MSKPTKKEVEESMNEHLGKIRSFTFGSLGEEPTANQLIAYMMANVSHVAELMWAAQVDMNKGLNLATELFKSVYTQFEKDKEKEQDEKAK